jgi:hypothetical protein
VALCAGNRHRAHRQLAERGLRIPRPTLEKWVQLPAPGALRTGPARSAPSYPRKARR